MKVDRSAARCRPPCRGQMDSHLHPSQSPAHPRRLPGHPAMVVDLPARSDLPPPAAAVHLSLQEPAVPQGQLHKLVLGSCGHVPGERVGAQWISGT